MVPAPRHVAVAAGSELRIELEQNEACLVKLLTGHAELFGMELAANVDYPFGDEARIAIFSFEGCTLEMSPCIAFARPHRLSSMPSIVATGTVATEYVSDETPMTAYYNLHLGLERDRLRAEMPQYDEAGLDPGDETLPPRVMIVGEPNAGKTTLSKTLINWTVRASRARGGPGSELANATGSGVMLVNLDPSEGGCSIPATHTVAPVYDLLPSTTPVHVFGTTYATGPPLPFPAAVGGPWQPQPSDDAMAPSIDALSLFYGHTEPMRNARLAELQLGKLSRVLSHKLDPRHCNMALWQNGVIIDTPSEWTDRSRSAVIARTCRELGVNVLLVVGGEKLFIETKRALDTIRSVRVIRVPKSPGASDRDLAYRRRMRDRQLRSYFYGGPALSQGSLSPHKVQIRFDDLKIYRVGEEFHAPSSALPIGATRATSDTQLVEVDPKQPSSMSELLNAIVAISQAPDDVEVDADEDNTIITSAALGYVHIAAIDVQREKYTVLIPLPGRLPRKRAILGSLDWQDAE